MKEILFRGKRKSNDKWIEGYIYKQIVNLNDEYYIRRGDTDYLVVPETVGQFTGLLDKNGNKIFEGDIVKHEGKIYEMKYLEKYARFAPSNEHSVFMVCAFNRLEVIGNIYDGGFEFD